MCEFVYCDSYTSNINCVLHNIFEPMGYLSNGGVLTWGSIQNIYYVLLWLWRLCLYTKRAVKPDKCTFAATRERGIAGTRGGWMVGLERNRSDVWGGHVNFGYAFVCKRGFVWHMLCMTNQRNALCDVMMIWWRNVWYVCSEETQ